MLPFLSEKWAGREQIKKLNYSINSPRSDRLAAWEMLCLWSEETANLPVLVTDREWGPWALGDREAVGTPAILPWACGPLS